MYRRNRVFLKREPEPRQSGRTSNIILRLRRGGVLVCRDDRLIEIRKVADTLGRSDIRVMPVSSANDGKLRGIDPLPDLALDHDVDTADTVFGEIARAAVRAYRHKFGMMRGVRS